MAHKWHKTKDERNNKGYISSSVGCPDFSLINYCIFAEHWFTRLFTHLWNKIWFAKIMGCRQSVCGTEFALKTVTNLAKIMGCRQPVCGTEFALKTVTTLAKEMGCQQPVCGTELCWRQQQIQRLDVMQKRSIQRSLNRQSILKAKKVSIQRSPEMNQFFPIFFSKKVSRQDKYI